MAYSPLPALIDKVDTFELVRDQLGAILALEQANQQALAIAAAKDPLLWALDVYLERSRPWEKWTNADLEAATNTYPIISVWFDRGSFPRDKGNPVERQTHTPVYNIDAYGYGITVGNVGAPGFTPADKTAALEAQRGIRLARNILMASPNTYLQLPKGTIGLRWPDNITMFQPQIDDNAAFKIVGARLALEVTCNEFSPQYEGETLELITNEVTRQEDGRLLVNANYDYS